MFKITPSYWCTWSTQNRDAERLNEEVKKNNPAAFLGDQGAQLARATMNEESIFRQGGWADYFPEIRGDLFFMLDDGWDVAYGIHPDKNRKLFGSLILDEERFPSFKGDNKTRLKQLSAALVARGWRGLGIWVAAQMCGDDGSKPFNAEENEAYWRTRLEESKFAEIKYWKVDWGARDYCVEFREMLTRLAHEIYPELIVEHAVCQGPLNGLENTDPKLHCRYMGDTVQVRLTDELLRFSDAFRSYDVIDVMSEATTLDRLSYILKRAKGIVNAEDEPYIAASLGCANGIMRSPASKERRYAGDRLQESVAAVRWQREVPAFAGGEIRESEELLPDTMLIKKTWFAPAVGKKITQNAPAVLARNAAFPRVIGERKPYVTCCAFNKDVYAVATHKRDVDGEINDLCEVICDDVGAPVKIGVFGEFKSLEFVPSRKVESAVIRSLFDDRTEILEIGKGDRIRLSGQKIASYASKTDESRPAFVIDVAYRD